MKAMILLLAGLCMLGPTSTSRTHGLKMLPHGPQGLESAPALQAAVQRVIRESEESVAYLMIVRGEPYDPPSESEPGKLGSFPGSDREKEAARKAPHLDPAHAAYVPEYTGNAVVIEAKGLLLTNYHVVRDARKIYVRLVGGKAGYANIHAADPRSDLAVLKLVDESVTLKPLKLGDASKAAKGQFVVTLAYAFGATGRELTPEASFGIISNLRRRGLGDPERVDRGKVTLHHYGTLLQTDARVPEGSSGGAVLDLDGNLVGLLSTLVEVAGHPQSASALPVDGKLKRVIEVLKTGSEVHYGFLGVNTRDVPANEMRGLNVLDGGGVRIADQAAAGTPAQKAQLRKGDILLSVNGQRVRDGDELFLAVAVALAGSPLELEILRDQQTIKVPVQELAKLGTTGKVIASQRPPAVRGLHVDYVSVLLAQIPPGRKDLQERAAAALRQGGVLVREVEPGSPAERAGLRAQDIITHVNDRPIESPSDFRRELRQAGATVQLALLPADDKSPPRKVRLE